VVYRPAKSDLKSPLPKPDKTTIPSGPGRPAPRRGLLLSCSPDAGAECKQESQEMERCEKRGSRRALERESRRPILSYCDVRYDRLNI
jgi:hypothetical protein